jgi:hypothetical protein
MASSQGLLPAFVDGWLDVIPPKMALIDGCESAYRYNSPLEFLQSALLIKGDAQSLVSPENRAKYRAQVQVSFGIYLDAYVNPATSPWHIDAGTTPMVDKLRQNVTQALKSADQYVWIYGEKHSWWPTPRTDINTTWESVLPGVDTALRFSADPDGYALTRLAALREAGKLVELTRNGDFGSDKTKDSAGAEVVYREGAPPAGWGKWEATDSGSFTWDKAVGNKVPGSAKAVKVGNGCFIQEILPVQPGERYYVSGSYRLQGQGSAWIRVRWQTADNKWTQEQLDKLLYGRGKAGEWVPLGGVAEVPPGAGKLIILLGVGGQPSDQDAAWFDDVHCYKVD